MSYELFGLFVTELIHNNVLIRLRALSCTPVNIFNINFKYSVCSLRHGPAL